VLNHFRLARCAFEEARTHDADADAGAQRSKTDHQSDADARERLDLRDQLQLVHWISFLN